MKPADTIPGLGQAAKFLPKQIDERFLFQVDFSKKFLHFGGMSFIYFADAPERRLKAFAIQNRQYEPPTFETAP